MMCVQVAIMCVQTAFFQILGSYYVCFDQKIGYLGRHDVCSPPKHTNLCRDVNFPDNSNYKLFKDRE